MKYNRNEIERVLAQFSQFLLPYRTGLTFNTTFPAWEYGIIKDDKTQSLYFTPAIVTNTVIMVVPEEYQEMMIVGLANSDLRKHFPDIITVPETERLFAEMVNLSTTQRLTAACAYLAWIQMRSIPLTIYEKHEELEKCERIVTEIGRVQSAIFIKNGCSPYGLAPEMFGFTQRFVQAIGMVDFMPAIWGMLNAGVSEYARNPYELIESESDETEEEISHPPMSFFDVSGNETSWDNFLTDLLNDDEGENND